MKQIKNNSEIKIFLKNVKNVNKTAFFEIFSENSKKMKKKKRFFANKKKGEKILAIFTGTSDILIGIISKEENPTADRRAKLSKQALSTSQKQIHPNFANRVQILFKQPKLWIKLFLTKRKSDDYIFWLPKRTWVIQKTFNKSQAFRTYLLLKTPPIDRHMSTSAACPEQTAPAYRRPPRFDRPEQTAPSDRQPPTAGRRHTFFQSKQSSGSFIPAKHDFSLGFDIFQYFPGLLYWVGRNWGRRGQCNR